MEKGENENREKAFRRHTEIVFLRSLSFLLFITVCFSSAAGTFPVLQPAAFAHHIERFNSMEDENVTNFISNADSWNWLKENIPLFECPDADVEEIYYFRWWSFRKHLVQTPNGFVFTEFLTPVNHAGAYNTISCATGFHIAEGRWLRNPEFVNDYIAFWLRGNHGKPQPHFHKFSSWFADAVYQCFLVNGDRKFVTRFLNDLIRDYETWETERQLPNGLFWQYDVRDGMEESISGSRRQKNIRPTINSYMFANARAISEIARLAGKEKLARTFDDKANRLQQLTHQTLWNPEANFFQVRLENGSFSNAREELGFIPWMFELPSPNWSVDTTIAWKQFTDPEGFAAPFGITTAERRHPQFRSHGVGTCEWDGAVWPFATSQTLNALANVLRDYNQTILSRRDYFDAFLTYVRSQHQNGKPYIGEYLDEVTGDWINGKNGRSRYYNHSTFADLLITGVVGLRPRADDVVEVWPLLPEDVWNWFCLDGVKYHGSTLTILWDKDGTRYHRGKGLSILCDGRIIARNECLQRLTGKLP
ncbi:MAG TPA: glycosyl hydrolase family 65 protein [Verrucomicrobiae bacterium]|nr:glycosyl hydrolase family 65 protein [Verrucomicrobiae bacterium]